MLEAEVHDTVAGTSIAVFRQLEGWDEALQCLAGLHQRRGAAAAKEAERFAGRYAGRRAAMVFDVVFSANRRYDQLVVPRVDAFQRTKSANSLQALAVHGVENTSGFRRYEEDAMRNIARSLSSYADSLQLDDDAACRRWATTTDPGVVHGLDPIVGRVKGIGLTLYRYLRMRCGADDMKPDRRVAVALAELGFPRMLAPEAIYALSMAVSRDSAIPPLVLDQLLWFGEDHT